MWRSISTRLFRQYVQAGIQTSGIGCQDDECKRSISPGFILPNYTLNDNGTNTSQSVRLYASASPRQREDRDEWEENERQQNFRCGNFWGSCRNYGNVAEAMGLGSAIVLGLQLNRALNNKDQDEQVEKGRLCRLAYAMPMTHPPRMSIMPPPKSTGLMTGIQQMDTKLRKKKDELFGESVASIEKVALDSLGETYNNLGLEFSRSRQFNLAFPYFHDGAKAGNCKAQFNLAVCYEHGRGVDTNDNKAAFWYKKAAIQGHAMAQYNYGIFHLLGRGKVKKNEKEAIRWLGKSADQGIWQAQSYLGSMLIFGSNKDIDNGIKYLREAVKQKDVEAAYRLGLCYEEGIGVAINHAKASDLYHKAAMKGHSVAQCCMGRFHQQGLGGIPVNITEAKAWFHIASENGNQEATKCLATLTCLESEEQLNVGKSPAIMHYSKSAPSLLGVLVDNDINLVDRLGSGDSKDAMWKACPSISYLDLLPSFHINSRTHTEVTQGDVLFS